MTGHQVSEVSAITQPRWQAARARCSAVLRSSSAVGTALALTDQAVVSGTSFLTTLFVGRLCGPAELGLYRLGITLVLLGNLLQQSFIAIPYTVFRNQTEPARRREFAGSALLHWGGLSLLAMVGLAAWSLVLSVGGGSVALAAVGGVLAALIPFLLLRDFARHYAYAELRVGSALTLDAAVSFGQIAGLMALFASGMLNGTSALATCGLAALFGALPWLWLRRHEFDAHLTRAEDELGRSWAFARWIFSARMATYLGTETFGLWLLASTLGKTATGIFVACETMALFANPFVQGISQYLTPKMSHAYAEGGIRHLRRVVWFSILLISGAMLLYCGAVAVFSERVMHLLYGDEYAGNHWTAVVLTLVLLADASSTGASKGLWVVNRPDLDLLARVIGLGVIAVTTPLLMLSYGVFGVALGLCLGTSLDSVVRCVLFEHRVAHLLEEERRKSEAAASGYIPLPSAPLG